MNTANNYETLTSMINDFSIDAESVLNYLTNYLGLQICDDELIEHFKEELGI